MSSTAAPPASTKSILTLALTWNLPVGLLAYSIGFMTSYFMNDQVTTSDDLRFITFGLVSLLVSSTAMTLTLHKSGATPLAQAATTSLVAGAALHAAFIAIVLALVN